MRTHDVEADFLRWRARGDAEALARVFDALSPGFLRLAIHVVGDAAAAEDVVQSAFLTAIERMHAYDAARSLEPWIAGIVLAHARKLRDEGWRARRVVDLEALEKLDADTPLALAEADEEREAVERAIDALDEPYRTVVLLRVKHGLDSAEIAHVVKASPSAVRVQLHRAREMLRRALPASLVGVLALLAPPARGLDLVRASVLEHARLTHVATIVGGVLVGKKLVAIVVALVALCSLVAWTQLGGLERDATGEQRIASESLAIPAEVPAVPATTRVTSVAGAEPRQSVARIEAGEHRFHGRVLDALSKEPVSGASVELFAPRRALLPDLQRRYAARMQPDEFGRPFARAWPVFVHEHSPGALAGIEALEFVAAPEEGDVALARTQTDADGSFVVGGPHASGFLMVEAAGYGVRRQPWTTDPAVARNVYVERAWRISGRIVDAELAPIAQRVKLVLRGYPKAVRVPNTSQWTRDFGQEDAWEIDTDGEGRFAADIAAQELTLYSADPSFEVVSHGPMGESFNKETTLRADDASKTIAVVLRRNTVLEVRDAATRAPIERFWLECNLTGGDFGGWVDWRGWFTVPNGRMSLTPELRNFEGHERYVEAGRARTCSVWAPGYARATFECNGVLTPSVVEVALEPEVGTFVEGSVVRAGTPLTGALVCAYQRPSPASSFAPHKGSRYGWSPFACQSVASDGLFRLELPSGSWWLRAMLADEEITLSVQSPSTAVIFDVAAHPTLEVVVRDADAQPLERHMIELHSADGARRELSTGSDGRVHFGLVPRGAQKLIVRAPPAAGQRIRELTRREFDLSFAEKRTVEIDLARDVARFARLVVEGAPTLVGWRIANRFDPTSSIVDIEPNGRIPVDLRQRDDFAILGPDGDTWHVRVPKDALDGYTIHLGVQGPGYEGTLTESGSGTPLANVEVRSQPVDRGDRSKPSPVCRTDAHGQFRLRGMTPEPHTLLFVRNPFGGDEFEGLSAELATLPSKPPTVLSIALPVRDGDTFRGGDVVRVQGRVRWPAVDLVGVQAHFGAVIENPQYTLNVGQPALLGAEGAFEVVLPRAAHYRASFLCRTTHAKSGILSWEATGGDVERKDFDLP